ncbi:MAG: hypothetical protein JWO32_94 [Bacteroidetes bacterium]|nr:hypothetical protein [Bacteroidota bacterium]
MIKYLFILINFLSIFLYSLFSGDGGVVITNNFPNAIKPGKEVNVEVKITKGNMSGFAKMQLELPAGLSVTEGDSRDANFTMMDGTAKWVWASLPAENEIILKLTLVADASAPQGKTVISGKYSFVENNAKTVVEMSPFEINIGGEATAVNNSNSNTSKPKEKSEAVAKEKENSAATTTSSETTSGNTQTNTNREPDGNITVERTITKGATEGEYVVNIKVLKGLTKGFARYSDDLPADLIAKAGKTEGASFSVADGKVKFVWVAVPEKEELDLSYSLAGIAKPVTLNGEYSFLEQNQSKKYTLKPKTITPEAKTDDKSTKEQTTKETTSVTETKEKTTGTNSVTPTDSQVNGSEKTTKEKEGTEPFNKKEGSVKYMVQVGAFTNSSVTADRLKKKFKISERIHSEFEGGFSKFMVGSHQEYKSARDHREKIKSDNGVASAFVVAYNIGKRITVQEALMISNQKWFK